MSTTECFFAVLHNACFYVFSFHVYVYQCQTRSFLSYIFGCEITYSYLTHLFQTTVVFRDEFLLNEQSAVLSKYLEGVVANCEQIRQF